MNPARLPQVLITSTPLRSLLTVGLLTGCGLISAPAVMPNPAALSEPYRPQYHFSPKANWINDPNGLVYLDGEYHLFYQYNPSGTQWGNTSWGHAVSTDLVHWKELPLALSHDDQEMVFSGSAVVDVNNTSGFGQPGKPAMVAVYTSAYKKGGLQAQSLAYSTDKGRTWTKYANNPVLDIGSNDFRDPKVQWYAPTQSWLMTVSLSAEHKVLFYSSKNLKEWTLLSEFGPTGAVGGLWECPDLFPLNVDGDPGKQKWVLVVNINPGGIAGGSAAQYFLGSFDGTRFTPDPELPDTSLSGTLLPGGDFESSSYGPWTAAGDAFGTGPAQGTLPNQQQVSGFEGARLVNSFLDGDRTTGTLTSPAFTITTPFLNFKVGGGRHPAIPGSITEAPAGTVLADFEGTTWGDGWTATGDFVNAGPAAGNLPGQVGAKAVDTCVLTCDPATGTITSPVFTVNRKYLNFLIAGGRHPWNETNPVAVTLLVNGQVVKSATGDDSPNLDWKAWDLSAYQGQQAQFQIVDQGDGSRGWDHLMVDQVMLSDVAAGPWERQTTVNLLVDGQVVQSATGTDSETLDWSSFDLRPYQGKQAQVKLIDRNSGGWGHLLADQFTFAASPAQSAVQRAHWVDYGKDNYAAVTWENTPDGKRVLIGWMNNWQYSSAIPTSGWRGAMTIPRELSLKTIAGQVKLTQQPVTTLNSLRQGKITTADGLRLTPGATPAIGNGKLGQAYMLDATLTPGTARKVGFRIRSAGGQQTLIGYDTLTQELYVDRQKSGATDFSPEFPGLQRAPLTLKNGQVRLRVLVDWSSVEVFGGDGEAVITDQIFPAADDGTIYPFAEEGDAVLDKLEVQQLKTYRQ